MISYLESSSLLKKHPQRQSKLNSVAFSPHASYTDRATAALSAKLVPTFADRGCHAVSATDPYGR
jgi:hypothetical protein